MWKWKWKLKPHVTRKFTIASKLRNSFPLLSKCSYSSLRSKILTTLFLISHLWCKAYIVSIHTNKPFRSILWGIFLRNYCFYYYCLVSCNCYLFITSLVCLVAAAVLAFFAVLVLTMYGCVFILFKNSLVLYICSQTFPLSLCFLIVRKNLICLLYIWTHASKGNTWI